VVLTESSRQDAGFISRRYGRFQTTALLGAGGTASVYLARSEGPGGFERFVAIKVMHPHLTAAGDAKKAFLQEAKVSSRIYHPNVVAVTEVIADDDELYLVMDYIKGDTLWALMKWANDHDAYFPFPIVLRILVDAFSGLHAAHELKDDEGRSIELVHRDVSPHNILLGLDGVTRLTDFGIAKFSEREKMTESGYVRGKVAYMSPEQALGAPLDRRSDVWAAGVVAWEALTGHRLHNGTNEATRLLGVISNELRRPEKVRPEIPVALGDAVMGALDRMIEKRTPTVQALAEDLLRAWGRPIATHAEVATYLGAALGDRIQERHLRMTRGSDAPTRTMPEQSAEIPQEVTEETLRTPEVQTRGTLEGTGQVTSHRGLPMRRQSWIWGTAVLGLLGVGAMFLAKSRAQPLIRPEVLPVAAVVATSETNPQTKLETSPSARAPSEKELPEAEKKPILTNLEPVPAPTSRASTTVPAIRPKTPKSQRITPRPARSSAPSTPTLLRDPLD
ncbi:MAG: protein kinase, partial [Polyangiaceae bacterium]|nr:protein kinase [Polyangiaceae bacterium]